MASAPGHDINYIALSGALHAFGRAGERPTPPINMVGDFGGGGMLLAFGMLAGLINAMRTGVGQVIDCAMTDGSALLMSLIWGMRHTYDWKDERGVNFLDTGAHFYDTYETADGKHISLGAIEPQIYATFLRLTGLAEDPDFSNPMDRTKWPRLKDKLSNLFITKSRAEWTELFEGEESCFAPVLSMEEATQHPHNVERETFIELGGIVQPAPAPRFSKTPAPKPRQTR
jgi:alpha-methylacyl-CoA racemase